MAGEVDKVAGAGLGFFSKTGELKSQDQLASEAKPKEEKTQIKETSAEDPESLLRSGMSASKERFVKQANEVISVANEDRQNLRAALKQNDKELEKAKELKQAINSGDAEKEEKARQELEELRQSREKLSSEIESSNRENSDKRVKNLNIGNQQKGIVKVEEARFEKREKQDLTSKEDVDSLISNLKSEKSDLKSQLDQNRATRKEIEGVVKEGRSELNSIEDRSIKSLGEAEKSAEDVASRITKQGSQAFLSNNLNESVVRSLLS